LTDNLFIWKSKVLKIDSQHRGPQQIYTSEWQQKQHKVYWQSLIKAGKYITVKIGVYFYEIKPNKYSNLNTFVDEKVLGNIIQAKQCCHLIFQQAFLIIFNFWNRYFGLIIVSTNILTIQKTIHKQDVAIHPNCF